LTLHKNFNILFTRRLFKMANEKMLNTRIQLKYDSYSNWTSNNPVLRAGEVAIAYLTTAGAIKPGEGDTQHPILFKVGPGNFNSLPWASALAADVHDWAKKTESEFTTWVKSLVSIEDIDAYSKGEVDSKLSANSTADQKYAKEYADSLAKNYDAAGTAQGLIDSLDVTDTAITGQYVSAVSETDGKISVTRVDLPTYALATGSANGTVAFNGADVAVKGLGSAAYTDSKAYDAAGAADAVNTALENYKTSNNVAVEAAAAKGQKGIDDAAAALAKANEKTTMAEVEAKNYATKAEAEGYADAKDAAIRAAQDAANAAQADIDAFFAAAETGDAALDTLKEIQDFLNSDSGTVQTLIDDVAGNKEAIADIIDGTTAVAKATNADKAADSDKLGGAVAADYLKKADAPGYGDILTQTNAATLYQPVGEYASAAQGAKADTAVQPAALDNYYTKSAADAEFMNSQETSDAIDAKITGLNLAATYEPIGAETRANAYADGLAKNYATAAQGAKADSALQEITTTANNGLKVTNKNQIDIDTDVVFVFNCGSSSSLVD
jgi:hypothetical protein